nr:hypothetical protein [Tanacetum cinerariifolium]
MAPKRTSTSTAPAMTQATIQHLVGDSVVAALEVQAANMANTDNTNRNPEPRETHAARKYTYKEFMSFQSFYFNGAKAWFCTRNQRSQTKVDDRRNNTNNVNNNYPNNRDNNNYPNDRNNHYHQQQNRRQETVRAYAATSTENKRGTPRCAFKVDIRKAYDTFDWPFVGKRGLRQGDLLSPYLFMLVMEILTHMLKRRVSLSESFRYHKHCEKLHIINVCFAGDLFLFAHGDVDSTKAIMESLDEFKFASGKLPVKYLGILLISSRLLNQDCEILVESAKNRNDDSKNKSLSFAGRLQLLANINVEKQKLLGILFAFLLRRRACAS